MRQIFLEEAYSKRSSNVNNFIDVELVTEEKLLPTEDLRDSLDEYDEYIKEKDASNKYRLIFTIKPVCSNILFNPFTEVVQEEGGDNCQKLGAISDNSYAQEYKGISSVDEKEAIRDTAYSHPSLGGLTYHCGINIFNNHTLRRREFATVNKLAQVPWSKFNTIEDYLRDSDGNIVKQKIVKIKATNAGEVIDTGETMMHLYTIDNSMSFSRTVAEKLVESDGWVGFMNPTTLNVPNVFLDGKEYTVNKCMNDKAAGEMIDMYPDRSLYSFLPKVNPFRKRLEYNWDYCLTYPYENYYDSPIIQTIHGSTVINGLKCEIIDGIEGTVFDPAMVDESGTSIGTENGVLYIRTQIKNSFQQGDTVNFTVIFNDDSVAETDVPIKVNSIGYAGEDTAHVFTVDVDDMFALLGTTTNFKEMRVRKCSRGKDCQYYFRVFRRLPNFKNADLLPEDGVSESDIAEYSTVENDFSSTLNKVAFSETIYSDRVAQVIYNDDIDTTGLYDNLHRELSELYFTIIKRNKGFEDWYRNEDYGSEEVEYSHCFGEVCSGLDLGPNDNAYNIHKISLNKGNWTSWTCEPLEKGITENGTNFGDGLFLGDIVEFYPNEIREVTLEDVYHRFNTVQREAISMGPVEYDDIAFDDYDIENKFAITGRTAAFETYCPEGYYYKPHYKVLIREFEDTINQKSDTLVPFTEIGNIGGKTYSGKTSINYHFNVSDKIYGNERMSGERIDGKVTGVSGLTINFEIENAVQDIKKYKIFKVNDAKPYYAMDLNDGTGRYIWKYFKSDRDMVVGQDELYNSIFTNGAHYFHKPINFYLRRQDPTGEYGLNREGTMDAFTGASTGKIKEVSVAEYIEEGEGTIC